MYCSGCGKKVLDTMRFCPFCGAKVIIPEQDDETVLAASPAETEETFQKEERFTFDMPEDDAPVEAPKPENRTEEETLIQNEPKRSETETPIANDLFMEENRNTEDDYDSFERSRQSHERLYDSRRESEDEDEEDYNEESFFSRHWKGLLCFVLLIVLAGGGVFFATTEMGQAQLAKINYPLPFIQAEKYGKLGFEAYQAGSYTEAGAYYERALAREPGSFNYAQSAAMAYIAANDTEKAAEMLKKCIELEPKVADLYLHLLALYPDPSTRPTEIVGILQRGYAETGDVRLKSDLNPV